MVDTKTIEKVLVRDGTTFTSFCMPEVRELQQIIMPNEQIKFCISGRYEGGFALICATDLRLLLVDKKFMYLTIEDIRYDMIVEVDYNYRMFEANIRVITPNKILSFVSTKKQPLRNATQYVQQRVMELRHQQQYGEVQQQPQPTTAQIMAANVQPAAPLAAAASLPTQDSGPLVSVQKEPTKQFMPRLPLRSMNRIRQVSHPYTQTSLSSRRRVSRFFPS